MNQGWDLCLPSKRKEKKNSFGTKNIDIYRKFLDFLFYFYFSVMNIPDFFFCRNYSHEEAAYDIMLCHQM